MKSFKRMVAMAVMVVATMASAEQRQVSSPKANIPFDFVLGKQVLPAGVYQVRVLGNALALTSQSGETFLALSHGVEANAPAEKSELVFVNHGGTQQLYRFWQAGQGAGREFSLTKVETKIAQRNADTTHVALGK